MFSGLRLNNGTAVLSINNLFDVQGFQCQQHLRRIELTLFLAELVLDLQQSIQFTSWTIFQNKVELLLILKGEVHAHQEWVVHGGKHLPFRHYLFLEVQLRDVLLLENLHGIDLIVLVVANQQNLSIATLADDTQQHEILDRGHLKCYYNIRQRSIPSEVT